MPLALMSQRLHGQRDKGVVEVQRRLLAMVAVCVAVLAGCSSSGDDAAAEVEIRVEMGSDTPAFTASGAAVDDGLVCATGQTLPGGEVETVDGQPSSDEEFAQAFDEALATEGVVERVFFVEFGCADAEEFSGTFTMQQNVRMDFTTEDVVFTGELTSG